MRSADLRGADLRDANLANADLREARTGHRGVWAAALAVGGLAVSVACGAVSGYAGRFLQSLLTSEVELTRGTGAVTAGMLIVALAAAALRSTRYLVIRVLPILVAVIVATAAIAIATKIGTGHGALAALALLGVVSATVALGALARSVGGTSGMIAFAVVAITGAVVGREMGGGLLAIIVAVVAAIHGQRALRGHEALAGLERLTARITCRLGGTSFRGADLTGADFEGATLESADFRGAELEGARFDDAYVHLCLFDGEPPPGVRTEKKKERRGRRFRRKATAA